MEAPLRPRSAQSTPRSSDHRLLPPPSPPPPSPPPGMANICEAATAFMAQYDDRAIARAAFEDEGDSALRDCILFVDRSAEEWLQWYLGTRGAR